METLSDALEESLEVFRPPPELLVSEWADAERFLSPESSAEPGRWDTDRAPFQREPMDSVKDPDLSQIVLMWSAQVGKTEVINNILGYHIHHDPAPILLVQPTLGLAEAFSKDRLAPMIRDTPALSAIMGVKKTRNSGDTILHKKFPAGHITLAGSNAPASLASRPIRIALFDECDRFPSSAGEEGDPISLGIKRTTTFFNRLSVLVSTPTIKTASRIETAYESSDKRRYHLPCPHCGFEFAMRFSEVDSSADFWKGVTYLTLRWEKSDPESAHFLCSSCGKKILHSHKFEMLKKGRWIKGAPEVKGTAGFHLNELYSPWKSWTEVVADFFKAKKSADMMKTFVNTSLGESWQISGDAPDWKRLYDRRSSYKSNEIPAGVRFLTAAADVQKDRIEVEVCGWGANGESWSIDYRIFQCDTSKPSAFAPLHNLLHEHWKDSDGQDISVLRLAIDSGYSATSVYRWAKKYPVSKVMAVKGSDELDRIFDLPTKKGTRQTLKDKEKIAVWRVGVSVVKRELYGWLKQELPSDESLKESGYPYGFCHFPEDYPEEYFKMLTAEVEDIKKIKGFPTYIWVKTYDRNEALDCRVYNRAAAATLGIDRDSAKVLDKLATKSRMEAKRDPEKKPRPKIVRKKSSFLT